MIFGEHFEAIYNVNNIFSIIFCKRFEAIYGINRIFLIVFL